MSRSKVTQQRGWVRGLFGSRSGAGKRSKGGHLAAPAPPPAPTPPPPAAQHDVERGDQQVSDKRKHSNSGDATAQSILESGLKMASPRSSSLYRRRSQKGRRSPLGVRPTNAMKAQRDRWSGGTCLDLSQATTGLAGFSDSIDSPAWGFTPAFANLSIKSCSLPQSDLRMAAAEKDAAWGFDAEPTAWSLDRAESFGGFFA